jgi:hypothetical protein
MRVSVPLAVLALLTGCGGGQQPKSGATPGGSLSDRPTLDSTKQDRIPAPIPTPTLLQYSVGQQVEIDASGFWHACRVNEINMVDNDQVVRAVCEQLPEGNYYIAPNQVMAGSLSRAQQLRPATGRIGSDLSIGKVTCYDSQGNRDDVSFLVNDWGKYTDLWGQNPGTFQRSGTNIVFSGGHLGGQTGREFLNDGFKFGTSITCSGHLS